MEFESIVSAAGRVLEAAGILVIVGGAVVVGLMVLGRAARAKTWDGAFSRYRQGLGRAILLGLEFLVGADIIRTVSEIPTLSQVVVLGIIVLIRTFLSFTLEVELEGRWPWQKKES